MAFTEITTHREVNHQGLRRWFSDEVFELIVWYDYAGALIGFQLCYDTPHRERALTWRKGSGFAHHQLDEGDNAPGVFKTSPLLLDDQAFPHDQVVERFRHAATSLEPELSRFVQGKLDSYAQDRVVPALARSRRP